MTVAAVERASDPLEPPVTAPVRDDESSPRLENAAGLTEDRAWIAPVVQGARGNRDLEGAGPERKT